MAKEDSVNSISSKYQLRKPAKYFSTRDLWYFFEIISQKSRHDTLTVNATVLTRFSVEELTQKQLLMKSEYRICRAQNQDFSSNKLV